MMANIRKSQIVQLIFYLAIFFNFTLAARSPINPDTSILIVHDGRITGSIDQYSKFFDSLTSKNYEISYHDLSSEDEKLSLYFNSQRLYQNLIIFPSKSKTLGDEVTASQLLEFTNDGGNILAITSEKGVQDDLKVFLNELGIFPSPAGYKVIDHFASDKKSSTHDVLKLDQSNIENNIIISSDVQSVIYSGSSSLLSNSQLLAPILQAPRTSYTIKKDTSGDDDIFSLGSQSHLVVGFQARNNARVLWVGSDDFFSNDFFESNSLFVEDLVDWTYCAKNVIKTTHVEHYYAFDKTNDEIYKIKDEVVYEIGLSEWDGSKWTPYKADDVQVEVRMLDPYYRLTLSQAQEVGESQIYTSGHFKLPDQHGMFTFFTNYKRSGVSFIEEKNVVTVRHLANDEYQRSWEIPNSWVYVASNVAVVSSFLLFVFIFTFKK